MSINKDKANQDSLDNEFGTVSDTVELERLKKLLPLLYHIVIVCGTIIGVLFFLFYVKVFPTIDSLQFINYLVVIFSASVITIMLPFFKTSKSSFLIPPFYDTSGNSFSPLESKLFIAL